MTLFKVRYHKIGNFLNFILPKKIIGITLAPFGIYLRVLDCSNKVKTHEYIHWQQQKELLFIIFYILYVLEWVLKLFVYGKKSYYNISFEREAFRGEKNIMYPIVRNKFGWFKYILK